MSLSSRIAAVLGLLTLSVPASAATIGGSYYATQYDYSEFFAATDGRYFQVILAGNAFPNLDPNAVARDLLPVMQVAKPRPALTFTYDAPPERQSPYYRLVLIFNPALDLGSYEVCRGSTRVRPGQPGTFYVYAVYCRNDQTMSETTAWTAAAGPTDPRIDSLFRQLFQVVFPDSGTYRMLNPNKFRR